MAVRPERIDVSGVDTTYRRKGAGEPLLYLHGGGLTRRWLPLYELLSERFDVIVPDHPGFGDTARPRWYRSLDDVVIHYADLLNALELPTVHVVGHSLGGLIAGGFASVYPDRVRSLTLLAPGPLPVVTPAAELLPPADLPPDLDIDSLLFNDNQDRYPQYRNGDDEGTKIAGDDGDPYADSAAWSHAIAPTLYRRLARVTAPSQVLVPDEDRLFDRARFEDWAHWLGDAVLVQVPGKGYRSGHLFIVQEPEAIARHIAAISGEARRVAAG